MAGEINSAGGGASSMSNGIYLGVVKKTGQVLYPNNIDTYFDVTTTNNYFEHSDGDGYFNLIIMGIPGDEEQLIFEAKQDITFNLDYEWSFIDSGNMLSISGTDINTDQMGPYGQGVTTITLTKGETMVITLLTAQLERSDYARFRLQGIFDGESVARKVKNIYVGVDNVARKIIKGYIGICGEPRAFLGVINPGAFNINVGNLPINFKSDIYGNSNGDGHYLVLPYNDESKAAYSDDGLNYLKIQLPSTQISDTVYISGKFLCRSGEYPSKLYYANTANLNSWTNISVPTTINNIDRIYSVNNHILLVDEYNERIGISTTGTSFTWYTPSTPVPFSFICEDICYGNGKYVAIMRCNTDVYEDQGYKTGYYTATSTDLKTWSNYRYFENFGSPGYKICYGNNVFIINAWWSYQIMRSTDGINWTPVDTGDVYVNKEICYSNGLFASLDPAGPGIIYSTDGLTWNIYKSSKIVNKSTIQSTAKGFMIINHDDGAVLQIRPNV